jgi:predicted transglutaminase-like cysteine proteinase
LCLATIALGLTNAPAAAFSISHLRMADLIEQAPAADAPVTAAIALPACLPTPTPAARPASLLGGAPSALEAMRRRQAAASSAVAVRVAALPLSDQCAVTDAANLAAAVDVSPTSGAVTPRSGRPDVFGSIALKVGHSPLEHKWQAVQRVRFHGGSGPWARLVAQAGKMDQRQRVAEINRWVNARLSFADDTVTAHQADQWSDAARTLRRGRGDCEDYAIAKMRLLEAAGVDPSDMYLVVARDLARQADHAILVVRDNDRLVVLDNGTDRVLESAQVRDYRPIMSFNAKGMWLHGFAAPQPAMPADGFRGEQLAMAR